MINVNTESQVLNLPIEDIIPNRFQPRLNFDESALKELAASIKEHGIIQPLVVRRLGEKYEIIAGERRYKASKLAGLTTVPAIISEMDDKKSAEVAIVENIQRKDLTSIEEAKSYEALLEKGYLTQEELAKKMGLSQSAISNKLRLLSLPPEVQNALMENKISERHARSLLQLKSHEEQIKWLNTIIEERITVKELDKRLKEIMKQDESLFNSTEATQGLNNDELIIEEKPIPNKFFNFLEDEQANMTTNTKTESKTFVDEVEMLDFMPSINEDFANTITESLNSVIATKDMSIANDLIEKLKLDLQKNDYSINVIKDENSKELKYTITIEKE